LWDEKPPPGFLLLVFSVPSAAFDEAIISINLNIIRISDPSIWATINHSGCLFLRIKAEEQALIEYTDYGKTMIGKRRFIP
jgi:hypothetical protein